MTNFDELLRSLEACPADEISRYVWPRQHADSVTEEFHDFVCDQAAAVRRTGDIPRSERLFE